MTIFWLNYSTKILKQIERRTLMMKRTFTSLLALWLYGIIGLLSVPLNAQTRIWSENFNNGNNLPAGWLNESARNNNRWVVNAEYVGTNGNVTPDAPSGITGAPRSGYLHVSNQRTGLVQNNAQYDLDIAEFSSVSTSWIDASFYRNVQLKLWYLANGQKPDELMNGDFGYADIRFKGQEEWFPLLPELHSTNEWTPLTVASPDFNLDHQQFQLRFVWLSNGDGLGEMPSFSVDDLEVSGTATDTGMVIAADFRRPLCPGRNFNVDYTITGLPIGGNLNVELSDASGSFSASTVVGSQTNITRLTGEIRCTLPLDVNASGAYRIRLVLSQTGQPVRNSFNALDLLISPLPIAGEASVFNSPICAGSSAIVSVSDFVGDVLWQSSTDGTNFEILPGSNLALYMSEALSSSTYFRAQLSTPGCSAVVSNAVQVEVAPAPTPGFLSVTPSQSCTGTEVELTLLGQSADITQYTWESTNDLNEPFVIISATEEPRLRFPVDATTYFRVMVQTENCPEGIYSNPIRATIGLEVICGYDPSDVMPNDVVNFSLVVTGHNGQPVNIQFIPGDGSDSRLFENIVDIDGLAIQHTYSEEGTFEYQFIVTTADGACVGFCSGSVNVSNQSVFIVNKFIFQYCAGMSDTVGFVTLGRFEAANQFQLELSDAAGSFDTPRVIGQSATSPIRFTIPTDIAEGTNYAFRIVSTAPRTESQIIMGNTLIRALTPGSFTGSDTIVCSGNSAELSYQVPGFDFREFMWLRSADGVRFDTLESTLNEGTYRTGPVTEPIYFKVIDTSIIYQCPLLVSPTIVVRPESLQLRVETTPENPMAGDSVFIRLWVTGGKPPYRIVASAQAKEGDNPVFEVNNLVNFPYVLKFESTSRLSVPYAFTVLSSLECGSAQVKDTLTILPFTANNLIADVGPDLRTCVNDTNRLNLSFTAVGRYNASNAFIIEAAGADGAFNPGRVLATLNQNRADTYLAQFRPPSDLTQGTALKLRVRATAPADTADYSQALTFFPLPIVPVITRDGEMLTSSNNDYTAFQWFLNNEAISDATNAAYTPSANGQYVVEVENDGGCKSRSAAFSFVGRPGLATTWQATQLYPNPTVSMVTIAAQLSTLTPFDLELVNALGQVIWSTPQQPAQTDWQYTLDLNAWPAGLYWLRLRSAEDQQAMPILKIAR
jgi:hypothetical protein